MSDSTFRQYFGSPLGNVEVCASDNGIRSVFFVETCELEEKPNMLTELAVSQLIEYFDGKRTRFDLPLDIAGTEFQKLVWTQLLSIPYGNTCSYRDIAIQLHNPKAVRAVGAANGKNPISIIVPCHRVIGENGKLTGYAGGLKRKAKLLALENPQTDLLAKEML